MTHEDEIRICKLAAHAILRDGHITDAEMQLIDRFIAHFGMNPAERRDILARNIDEDVAAMAAEISSDEARRETLMRLAEAVSVDGHVAHSERSIILKCAHVMGIDDKTLFEITAGKIKWE